MPILIGNTFPLSLVRRRAVITPMSADDLRTAAAGGFRSFWGHQESLHHARAFTGIDLTTGAVRPVLSLSPSLLPVLDGCEYSEVWVISPETAQGSRPAPGAALTSADITGWQVLLIRFEHAA